VTAEAPADLVAEVENLRAKNAALCAELAAAQRVVEGQSTTIACQRAMLREARAATRRPAGLDGRRLSYTT
jgi:hypothetical protein